MLNYILKSTSDFLECTPKGDRKKIGQFFTSKETAMYMASLFNNFKKDKIKVLDPGAGTGILIAALVDRLQATTMLKEINITCYENNEDILPLLLSNMEYLKNKSKIKIDYHIESDNYILSQKTAYNRKNQTDLIVQGQKYDLVIGNPPYLKISRNAMEALAMPNVCFGAPNLYFLFASMSLFNLANKGELVYIMPRSWTSGAYFKKFREYVLENARITHIHLFISRDKLFDNDQVLQEIIILKLIKTTSEIRNILITSSANSRDFDNRTSCCVPYNTIINEKNRYIYLVTSKDEIQTLGKLNGLNYTLGDVGLRMKTGLTVDFRKRELLRMTMGENVIPLFYPQHIQNGGVNFPIGKEWEYIVDTQKGMIQKNKNYLFIKRFTTKEEKRRLQCGIYLSDRFPQYRNISTQNKINFIDTTDNKSGMCEDLIFGLYAIFNSTSYDLYYRVLNGSTQVNSTEINTMPIPSHEKLVQLGKKLKQKQSLSTEVCDLLLEELFS